MILIVNKGGNDAKQFLVRTLADLSFWINFHSHSLWVSRPNAERDEDITKLDLENLIVGVKPTVIESLDPIRLGYVFSFWSFKETA